MQKKEQNVQYIIVITQITLLEHNPIKNTIKNILAA